jgi:hypothetical protein
LFTVKLLPVVTDAHRGGGGGGGGTSCYPSKNFDKLDHKKAIKQENRGPPPRFSYNPKNPPSKEFENDCASMPLVYIRATGMQKFHFIKIKFQNAMNNKGHIAIKPLWFIFPLIEKVNQPST